jgi:hypothetical protein
MLYERSCIYITSLTTRSIYTVVSASTSVSLNLIQWPDSMIRSANAGCSVDMHVDVWYVLYITFQSISSMYIPHIDPDNGDRVSLQNTGF